MSRHGKTAPPSPPTLEGVVEWESGSDLAEALGGGRPENYNAVKPVLGPEAAYVGAHVLDHLGARHRLRQHIVGAVALLRRDKVRDVDRREWHHRPADGWREGEKGVGVGLCGTIARTLPLRWRHSTARDDKKQRPLLFISPVGYDQLQPRRRSNADRISGSSFCWRS